MLAPAPALAKGEVIDATAARIALWGALAWAEDTGMRGTRLSEREWVRLLGGLAPREAVVVILHAIRGQAFAEIATWLGVSRTMTMNVWNRAAGKLRASTGNVL